MNSDAMWHGRPASSYTHPGGNLPDKLNNNADLIGFYRLANNPHVTHAKLMDAHRARTRELMERCQGVVLVLHDTTEIDFSGLESVDGLGPIGHGGQRASGQRRGRRGLRRRDERLALRGDSIAHERSDFCLALAKLGGHLNRMHDGPPGWLVLWRGWTKLQLLVDGARIGRIRSCV